jgi:hypothetical protein
MLRWATVATHEPRGDTHRTQGGWHAGLTARGLERRLRGMVRDERR